MPDNGMDLNWEWIKEALPSLNETKQVYTLVNLLAKPSQCTLQKLQSLNPQFANMHKVFKLELSKLSNSVKQRNHEYDYLDPHKIACSIDI